MKIICTKKELEAIHEYAENHFDMLCPFKDKHKCEESCAECFDNEVEIEIVNPR